MDLSPIFYGTQIFTDFFGYLCSFLDLCASVFIRVLLVSKGRRFAQINSD